MSIATALPTPRRAPERPPHIDIAPTREQKRARPRLVVALVTVGGLFVILAAQLLLSIATSDGAYRINALQTQQVELGRDQDVLREQLDVLEAPQHLAASAQSMGMVASTSAAYLDLADNTVKGVPTAASASSALRTAADGSPLIPNALLAGVPIAGTEPGETASAGAPEADAATASVPSDAVTTPPAGIPSPTTR